MGWLEHLIECCEGEEVVGRERDYYLTQERKWKKGKNEGSSDEKNGER